MNSPGGSAFGSDVVAREIKSLRAAGKPIVVSMGDLAASGGYYISAPADVIYAEPSTLSGSIGVFGYKVDAQKLLGTLGINVETYRRGAHADFLSPYRPWTPEEHALAEQQIRHLYQLFVATVAEGRAAGASPRRASTSWGRGTSGPARSRRPEGSSTGWAASARPSTRRRGWAARRSDGTTSPSWSCSRPRSTGSCAG